MHCNSRSRDKCALLRQYIEQSCTSTISFLCSCETFWNLDSRSDLSEYRRWWLCPEERWRCQTGQWIYWSDSHSSPSARSVLVEQLNIADTGHETHSEERDREDDDDDDDDVVFSLFTLIIVWSASTVTRQESINAHPSSIRIPTNKT